MKLAVGYPLLGDDDHPFLEVVSEHRARIAEVYFGWPGEPSGRSPFGLGEQGVSRGARDTLEGDLRHLRAMGVGLDLLLNANCYGPAAASPQLAQRVSSLVERVIGDVGLDVVTTASPFIAAVVKERFPDIVTRASVNMRIGSVQGMSYLADVFDSFCIQRDYNRDLARIGQLREWADRNHKELCVLANSGCLSFCSGQTYHDNLVAHESEMMGMASGRAATLVCRRFLARRENWAALLQATWIRPEDLSHYQQLFDLAKVATRMHSSLERVVAAYATGRFAGNLLDLLEPGYSDVLGGHIIDSTQFPSDWHDQVTSCSRDCHACSYCARVLDGTLMQLETACSGEMGVGPPEVVRRR